MDYKVDWLEIARRTVYGYHRGFLRSVLKLDRNFHVYIHGQHEFMDVKQDCKGTFLKLYFKQIK